MTSIRKVFRSHSLPHWFLFQFLFGFFNVGGSGTVLTLKAERVPGETTALDFNQKQRVFNVNLWLIMACRTGASLEETQDSVAGRLGRLRLQTVKVCSPFEPVIT